MALKKKISKVEHEALKPEVQSLYKANGENEFIVDLDGDEDPAELKRALDRERKEKKDAQDALKAKTDKEAEDAEALARGKGDLKTLEDSWKTKLAEAKNKSDGTIQKLRGAISKTLVDNVAAQMARDISNSPALILPHIKSRITVEYDSDGEPTTRVLDKDGKVSALTVADLQTEIASNKDFSSIILATRASGGARSASQQQAGGAGIGQPGYQPGAANQPPDMSKMNPQQLVAHLDAVKAAT